MRTLNVLTRIPERCWKLAHAMEMSSRFIHSNGAAILSPSEFVLELRHEIIERFVVELSLLRFELARSVRVRSATGPTLVLQALDLHDTAVERTRIEGDVVHVELKQHHLSYVLATCLRAYRDEQADVDHISIDLTRDAIDFALTIVFERFNSPLASDESKRLMRRHR